MLLAGMSLAARQTQRNLAQSASGMTANWMARTRRGGRRETCCENSTQHYAGYVTPHACYVTRHASYVILHAGYVTHHLGCVARHADCVPRYASCVPRYVDCVERNRFAVVPLRHILGARSTQSERRAATGERQPRENPPRRHDVVARQLSDERRIPP